MPALGSSLAVQWLGLGACTAAVGSVPGQGDRILQVMQCGQKKKKKHVNMEGKRLNLSPRHLRKRKKAGQISWRLSSWKPKQLDCPCKRQSFSKSSDQISSVKNQTNKPARDFPEGAVIKNLPCNAGDEVAIPGWGTRFHMSRDN